VTNAGPGQQANEKLSKFPYKNENMGSAEEVENDKINLGFQPKMTMVSRTSSSTN
jgi:hypothetical protein